MALVPARSGSKGVPGKNVADLCGFPLIAFSIRAGFLADEVDRVIVTTDSAEIAQIGESYGANAPFLRPAELAGDGALDIDYVRHALDWLGTHERAEPEMIVQLRPTTPLRDPRLIDDAIRQVREREWATGLRSVHQLAEPPQKMMGVTDGRLTGLFPDDARPDYHNLPRQAFPPAYQPNGYVDVVLPRTVSTSDALYGNKVVPFITDPVIEVDTPEDLEYLRYRLERRAHPLVESLLERQD